MQNVTLNTGAPMPILGFGVFQIPPDQTEQAVAHALAAGYRKFDTAAAYQNEEAVGRALGGSGIAREELFVTTKLWVQDNPAEDNTRRAFEGSVKKLGLDYLDLYLMHQPFGDVYGQWRAMEGLYREGRIRAIGVSNFYPDRLVDLAERNEIAPAVNQIEIHPFFQRADYQELLEDRGVVAESWGPFAAGKNNLFTDPVLTAVAHAHGRSVAQVVLRWLIQRGIPVNAKSSNPQRMSDNLDIFDLELSGEQMAAIATLDTGASLYFDHRDPAIAASLGSRRLA